MKLVYLALAFLLFGCIGNNFLFETKAAATPTPNALPPALVTWEKQDALPSEPVIFKAPLEGKDDLFQENLGVFSKSLNGEQLDDFVALQIVQLEQSVADFSLKENSAVNVSGLTGKQIIFTGKSGDLRIKIRQYYLERGGNVFVFTYTAEEKSYDKFEPEADHLIASIITS